MSRLDRITKGRIRKPYAIVIYGVDGVGKTRFGANAPNPLFAGTEEGSNNMDVARLPTPETWSDIRSDVRDLIKDPRGYKTLVLDSLDWAEPMLHRHIVKLDGAKSMELAAGGYGKAYKLASTEWREILGDMNQLRDKHGMHLILIAHSKVVDFSDPQNQANYNRYQLKLREDDCAIFREWADAVLFVNYETFTKEDANKKTRAFGSGSRILYTDREAGFDAKNRLGLPSKLEFHKDTSWLDFVAAAEAGDAQDPDVIYARIVALMTQSTKEEQRTVVMEYIDRPLIRQNPAQLLATEERVKTMLGLGVKAE